MSQQIENMNIDLEILFHNLKVILISIPSKSTVIQEGILYKSFLWI